MPNYQQTNTRAHNMGTVYIFLDVIIDFYRLCVRQTCAKIGEKIIDADGVALILVQKWKINTHECNTLSVSEFMMCRCVQPLYTTVLYLCKNEAIGHKCSTIVLFFFHVEWYH